MYTTYDTPGEFFNISPTTAAYTVGTDAITIGTYDAAKPTSSFLANLTDDQAHATTGSTAQVIFGIADGIYQRFAAIKAADATNAPSKMNIVRSSYEDTLNGTLVRTYSFTFHLTPGSLVAVNS